MTVRSGSLVRNSLYGQRFFPPFCWSGVHSTCSQSGSRSGRIYQFSPREEKIEKENRRGREKNGKTRDKKYAGRLSVRIALSRTKTKPWIIDVVPAMISFPFYFSLCVFFVRSCFHLERVEIEGKHGKTIPVFCACFQGTLVFAFVYMFRSIWFRINRPYCYRMVSYLFVLHVFIFVRFDLVDVE